MHLKNSYSPCSDLDLLESPLDSSKSYAPSQTNSITPNCQLSPLKDAFKELVLGTAISNQSILGEDNTSLALALQHFNAFTPENCMKPDAIQPEENQFQWYQADRIVELAEQANAAVVGHTLVWHSQTPEWFFQNKREGKINRELALTRMRKHISTVVGRYKGRVSQWDVVNEAISDESNEFLRPSPWLSAIGDDYIAEAFHAAHEADPNAILIYNDYSNDRDDKCQKTVRLLQSLIEKGVPIHAVGMQCHWQLANASLEETERAIRAYSALGIQVMITELDISVLKFLSHKPYIRKYGDDANLDPYRGGLPYHIAQEQADLYKRGFEMFLRYADSVKRVSIWGTHDGESWLNHFPVRGRTDYPLPFDRDNDPKPAFFAIREVGLQSNSFTFTKT